jgi:small nuclear ribonucleoprotein E
MNRGGGGGGRKVLLPPINFIFKLLQQHSTVQIWLYEQLAIRIEGRIRVSCTLRDTHQLMLTVVL